MSRKLISSSFLSLVTSLIFAPTALAAPSIGNITTDTSQLPRYEKFEVTFQVQNISSQTNNLYVPYDPTPPNNLRDQGITVDAQFLPPGESNWTNAYTQPAFYYQDFLEETRQNGNQDWLYPTNNFSWKVRYAPNQTGTWQFRLIATDSSGTTISGSQSFSVTSSNNPGYVRVSQADSRYFEFENGQYFPATGYNMNFSHIDWKHPIQNNLENFQIMGQNNIKLIRMWLSQWSIFGAGWNPWKSLTSQGGDPPLTLLKSNVNEFYHEDHEHSLIVGTTHPCVFQDRYNTAPVAVTPDTQYHIRMLVYPVNLTGSGGFSAKLGDWQGCDAASSVTPLIDANSPQQWQWVEDSFTADASVTVTNQSYLDHLYLHLDNISSGQVRVAQIEIRELQNGQPTGPNILQKPWMDHHRYFDQRNSYGFDQVLKLAEQNDVYLRPVIGDHREWTFTHIDHSGEPTGDFDGSGFYFYGPSDDTINKTRWLQRAWWRYLQARWGYSQNIHSWEYVNEGDPGYSGHRISANLMGEYFHQHTPHQLASTSVWSGTTSNWNLNNYPGIDFGDVHRYIDKNNSPDLFYDAAQMTLNASQNWGAAQTNGNWPVFRGETGFTDTANTNSFTQEIKYDLDGIWLHNFLWAGINPNALIESYWYEDQHIYCQSNNPARCPAGPFDHRPIFKTYYDFFKNIPLSNGNYQAITPIDSPTNLRIIGQQDTLSNRAHVWVQNQDHTWKNVVDNVSISPVSATITLTDFSPNTNLTVETWNTYTGTVASTTTRQTDNAGNLDLPVQNLTSDTAFKIGDYDNEPPPQPGDYEPEGGDGDVDINDFWHVIQNFLSNYSIFDFNQVITHFGS